MPRHELPALGYHELAPGDEWESPRRTVTEADVVAFAGLSGDFNPIHVDHEMARQGPFGRPLAHGLLGMAMASGLTSQAPRVDTIAFLGILQWKFLRPILIGDTLRVVSTVEAVEPRSRGRRGVVTWRRLLLNQDGHTVQEGRTQSLVRGPTAPTESDEAPMAPSPPERG